MTSWADTKARIGEAIEFLQAHQVPEAAAAVVLGSLPVVGPLLQELYDRNTGSGQGGSDVIAFLQALQAKDEAQFTAIGIIMQSNQQALLEGQKKLEDLVSLNSAQTLSELRRVEENQRQLRGMLVRLGFKLDRISPQPRVPGSSVSAFTSQQSLLGEGVLRQSFVGTSPIRLVASRDGAQLYVSNFGSDSVSNVSIESMKQIQVFPVGNQPSSLALSPDGRVLYVGNNGGGVSIIDLSERRTLGLISTPGPVRDLAISNDGRKVYLALEYQGLGELDTATNQVTTVSHVRCPEGVALTPDGSRLYVSYQCTGPGGSPGHDAIGVYDVPSDTLTGTIKDLPNVGGAIAVSPNGLQVWVNGSDACSAPQYDHNGCPFVPAGVINVIDVTNGGLVKTMGIPPEYGTGLISFSQDSRLAVVGGNYAKVFDTVSFLQLKTLDIPMSGSSLFSQDGESFFAPIPTQNRVAVIEAPT